LSLISYVIDFFQRVMLLLERLTYKSSRKNKLDQNWERKYGNWKFINKIESE